MKCQRSAQAAAPNATRFVASTARAWAAVTEGELIEQVRDAPDDPTRWAVYADLLQGRGEVRGQLIALALAKNHRAEQRLRDTHQAQLGGDVMWASVAAGRTSLTWAFGHVVRATFWQLDGGEVVRQVLESPLTVALERLIVRLPADDAAREAVLELVARAAPSLQRVELLGPHTGGPFDGSRVLAALPRLTSAHVVGLSALGAVRAARLKALELSFADQGQARPVALEVLDAPSLRELKLRVRHETRPSLTRWLRERCLTPDLRGLSVESTHTSQLIEAIVDAPFAKTLRRLNLLVIDDAAAHALLTHRARLPGVRSIDARFFRTSFAVEAALKAAFAS